MIIIENIELRFSAMEVSARRPIVHHVRQEFTSILNILEPIPSEKYRNWT